MGGQAGAGSVGLLRSKLRTESTQRRRRSAGRVTAAASGPTAEHCCQPSRPSSTLDSLRCRLRWTTTNCSQRATRLYAPVPDRVELNSERRQQQKQEQKQKRRD